MLIWILNLLDFFAVDDALMNVAMPIGISLMMIPLFLERFALITTLIMMLIALYAGMYLGEWENNILDFHEPIDGVMERHAYIMARKQEGRDLLKIAFEGVLDLDTGEFVYVNAGHDAPFICRRDGSYEPLAVKPGFVLAGMEGTKFSEGRIILGEGDKLFHYTDGVTEATNIGNELYGKERLLLVLNKNKGQTPKETLSSVKTDIDHFVSDAPQIDDITMLCVEYRKKTF